MNREEMRASGSPEKRGAMRLTCTKETAAAIKNWVADCAARTSIPYDEVMSAVAHGLTGENKENGKENPLYEEFPHQLRCQFGLDRALSRFGAELVMDFAERIAREAQQGNGFQLSDTEGRP